ncbi:MAG: hypothetical protein ABI658_26135 [Acidimicrobiales bacterium]
MRPPNRIRLVIALALVALTAAGCGSSGDGDVASGVTLPPLASTTRSSGTTLAGATTAPGATTAGVTTRSGGVTTTVAGAKGKIDPCKVVTRDEAETLARTTLQAGVLVEGEDPSCTYSGLPNGPTAQVEIFAGDGAKKYYDIDVQLGHQFTTVAGLGDEAHLEEFTIFTRKGTTWLAIHLVRLDDPDPYNTPLTNLARTAVGRL